MGRVGCGLDELNRRDLEALNGLRVGLVCHAASVDRQLNHAAHIFRRHPKVRLAAIFGPQHGLWGETQANMVEWEGSRARHLGLRVHSLYGRVRKPTRRMLSELDLLVVDLQDVGSKVYTYIWTLYLALEAAAESRVAVLVLDRPNPIGGRGVEGEITREGYRSFVGLQPLPHRHGMTIGELATMFNSTIGADLSLVKMRGWKRSMWFDQTGLPWVAPSPNMPTLTTAAVYPGTVLLEGTNCSEGRGTTRPFQLFGAPWIDSEKLTIQLNSFELPGARFLPAAFVPAFDKHAGKLCRGAELHLIDRTRFHPYRAGVAILRALWELYPSRMRWRRPPYEYEGKRLPIDIISGSNRLRRQIEALLPLDEIVSSWRKEEKEFRALRDAFLIYPK